MNTLFITRMILLYQDINVPTFLLNQCIPDFLLVLESFIFVLSPFVYALCDLHF
jgi:hypothetical protein